MTADPLAPVAQALREQARREAARVLDAARAEAARIVDGAQSQADALLARAREEARADAAAVASGHRARGRRRARSMVLAARRQAFEELVAQAHREVCAELDTPQVGEALTAWARKALGAAAVIQRDGAGVVTATAGARRLRLSLDDFADKAITDLGLGP